MPKFIRVDSMLKFSHREAYMKKAVTHIGIIPGICAH